MPPATAGWSYSVASLVYPLSCCSGSLCCCPGFVCCCPGSICCCPGFICRGRYRYSCRPSSIFRSVGCSASFDVSGSDAARSCRLTDTGRSRSEPLLDRLDCTRWRHQNLRS
ncbi:hypothetical protein DFH06DRAFT_1237481 [Mycena polygramma]|nr:hypothetical protein DFH06DRAFT_1237481 [Mycena polygramma]